MQRFEVKGGGDEVKFILTHNRLKVCPLRDQDVVSLHFVWLWRIVQLDIEVAPAAHLVCCLECFGVLEAIQSVLEYLKSCSIGWRKDQAESLK